MTKNRLLALLLIVGAGAALRLFHLGHSLRVDELETWAYSQRPLWDIVADLDRLPHVSLLSRLAEALLGRAEFFLRLPFALYGVLTLPLIFLTGRELFDDETGLVAALLLAVSAFHVGYCQEPRYYAPFTFYSLGAFYCLMRLLRGEDASGSVRWSASLAGFLIAHVLSLSLHRMAVYPLALSALLIAFHAGLRGFPRDAPSSARRWVPTLSILLILAAVVITQWHWLRDAFVRESRGSMSLRMSYLTWHYRDPRASVAWELLGAYSGGRPAAALILAAGAAGAVLRGREGWRRTAPLLAWILIPLASLAVVRTRTHFELRYFIFLLPMWLLWAASGLSAVASSLGARRRVLLGLVAALIAFETPSLAGYYRLPKSRMRETFDLVNASCSAGDAVVMYPAWDTLWYGYYRLKEGCRLFHPANLQEDSPAFSPETIVGASRRVWLAGTWVADPVRAEEFERMRGLLSRRCEPEEERVFRSRDPNDDYRVSSYRCRAERAAPRPAAAPSVARDPRPSFWRWEGYRLLANLPQAVGRARERRRFSKDLALVSGKTGRIDAGPRDKILLVWNGEGTLAGPGAAEGFSTGDVFFLPGSGTLRWRSASPDAALLELDLPGGADASGGVPRRLGNALDPGLAQAETVLLRGRGWRLVVFRMEPGAEQSAAPDSDPPMARMLSVLLRGRLRIHWKEVYYHPFPGDLFTAEKFGIPCPWILANPGPEGSTELRFILEGGAHALPTAPMTSSTGKGVGAWPPMLVQ